MKNTKGKPGKTVKSKPKAEAAGKGKTPQSSEGLPPLRPGIISCLKCAQEFNSLDVTVNRVCPKCNKANRRELPLKVHPSTLYLSGRSYNIEE